MHPGGRKCQHHVARFHRLIVDDILLVDRTDGKTGEIVFVHGIEAGHFRGFAADERAAGLHTALRHAGDNRRNLFRHILAAGDIIEEEKRTRTAANDVVYTHGDTVDADGVMLVHEKRKL